MSEARDKKRKKLILDTLLILEGGNPETALNYKEYKEKLKNMSGKELDDLLNKHCLRLNVIPFDYEFKLENVKKAMASLGRPLEEKVTVPFMFQDPEVGDIISDKKVMILRLPVIKLIQKAATENAAASSTSKRDKTNQVISDSKGAGISDSEIQQLTAGGYTEVQRELLTMRADNDLAKKEAYANILATGGTTIPENVDEGKVALLYAYACYIGMGIDTDLLK